MSFVKLLLFGIINAEIFPSSFEIKGSFLSLSHDKSSSYSPILLERDHIFSNVEANLPRCFSLSFSWSSLR